jgi:hypothetical protein
MYSTKYFIKAKNACWCINIYLAIEIKKLPPINNYYKINNNIGIKYDFEDFSYDKNYLELPYLIDGINMIQEQLSNIIKNNKILIEIKDIKFGFCDFQEEGLTMAIIKLMSEVYGFKMPNIPVHFDKQLNKYIFDL